MRSSLPSVLAPIASMSAVVAAMVFAASLFTACKSDYADFTGEWRTDWGQVEFTENVGSYTDTYGTGPGTIELSKTGDHQYSAKWGESDKRHGTMTLKLSPEGNRLTGTWTPDPDCSIGGKAGGGINWAKKR